MIFYPKLLELYDFFQHFFSVFSEIKLEHSISVIIKVLFLEILTLYYYSKSVCNDFNILIIKLYGLSDCIIFLFIKNRHFI